MELREGSGGRCRTPPSLPCSTRRTGSLGRTQGTHTETRHAHYRGRSHEGHGEKVARSGGVEVGCERRCVRYLPPGLRRLLSRLHSAWGQLLASVGAVQPHVPHALRAKAPAVRDPAKPSAAVPAVSTRVAVSRGTAGPSGRLRSTRTYPPPVSIGKGNGGDNHTRRSTDFRLWRWAPSSC